MLRTSNRPLVAYFDAIKNLRLRQLTLILKTGYDPNLMVNARGQNGLQFMVNYFGATDAHFRLQAPINKAAYLSVAKLLLDSGLDANSVDLLSGETVLFDAIRFNDKDMVSLLLSYSDFALRNKNGETAVMCAARFGSKQVMRMILEHLHHLDLDGYFLRQRNRLGLSALELARVENLDCAKVITKHLIAYGLHTSAVLTRSSSHHQLLPRANYAPYHARAPTSGHLVRAPAPAAGYLDDSDLDELELAEVWPSALATGQGARGGPRGLASVGRGSGAAAAAAAAAAANPTAGFYDPKAAEFNQYLLEQQQELQQQQQLGASSDEEDAYFGGVAGAAGGSGLTRSRSCMLGPAAANGAKQPKYAASTQTGAGGSKKAAGSGEQAQAKLGSSSWESGGRSTIA